MHTSVSRQIDDFCRWISTLPIEGGVDQQRSIPLLVRIGCASYLLNEGCAKPLKRFDNSPTSVAARSRYLNVRRMLHVDTDALIRIFFSSVGPLPDALVVMGSLSDSETRIWNAYGELVPLFAGMRDSFPDLWQRTEQEVLAEVGRPLFAPLPDSRRRSSSYPSKRPVSPRVRPESSVRPESPKYASVQTT